MGGDRQAIDNGTARLPTTGANIFASTKSRPIRSSGFKRWVGPPTPPRWASAAAAPHADSRNMVIEKNGEVLEVDDGGIFRASLGTGVPLKSASLTPAGSSSVQLGEFVSADYDPLTGDSSADSGTTASQSRRVQAATARRDPVDRRHLVEATSSTIGGATVPTYFSAAPTSRVR